MDDDNNGGPTFPPGVSELARRIPGGIDQPDEDRAKAAIEDAVAEVLNAAIGQAWTDPEGEVDPPPIAIKTTLAIARHFFRNPDGYRSEQIGEYAYQKLPDELRLELDKIRALSGDITSVPTTSELQVSGTTAAVLGQIRAQESMWLP